MVVIEYNFLPASRQTTTAFTSFWRFSASLCYIPLLKPSSHIRPSVFLTMLSLTELLLPRQDCWLIFLIPGRIGCIYAVLARRPPPRPMHRREMEIFQFLLYAALSASFGVHLTGQTTRRRADRR